MLPRYSYFFCQVVSGTIQMLRGLNKGFKFENFKLKKIQNILSYL